MLNWHCKWFLDLCCIDIANPDQFTDPWQYPTKWRKTVCWSTSQQESLGTNLFLIGTTYDHQNCQQYGNRCQQDLWGFCNVNLGTDFWTPKTPKSNVSPASRSNGNEVQMLSRFNLIWLAAAGALLASRSFPNSAEHFSTQIFLRFFHCQASIVSAGLAGRWQLSLASPQYSTHHNSNWLTNMELVFPSCLCFSWMLRIHQCTIESCFGNWWQDTQNESLDHIFISK